MTIDLPQNGISEDFKVLVVGGGFGGLSSAIACAREGLSVELIERGNGPSPYGDAIGFGPNASRIALRWGVGEEMWKYASQGRYFNVRDAMTGKILHREDNAALPAQLGYPMMGGPRAKFYSLLWDKAVELGVKMRTNTPVDGYEEDAGPRPCVVLKKGEKVSADVILAADGIKSKAKLVVFGYDDPPRSSGYAVYRAFAPADALLSDPLTAPLADGCAHSWVGHDMHGIIGTFGKPGSISHMSFAVTRKDTGGGAIESWNAPGKLEDVLACLDGWDPVLRAGISKFPSCIDWKLSWHDPLPTWVSKDGRITLLGDAAHNFLPTSIQGGSMAWEDGATLGICLALADKTPSGVRLALRTFEKLRFDRRDNWHKADATASPDKLALTTSGFYDHDAQRYALDHFEGVARGVLGDGSFKVDLARLEKATANVNLDAAARCQAGDFYGPE